MKQIFRLITIVRVLVRYRLQAWVVKTHVLGPFRFALYIFPSTWSSKPIEAANLRRAIEDLGPIFIKFGQALSTRPDILPADIANELAKLQDQVPPFPGQQAITIIEKAFSQDIDSIFATFEVEPLASASIAQVHVATLNSGEDVVVKVLRPGIRRMVDRDIHVLETFAQLAQRYWADSKRFRPAEVVSEYKRTINAELDLLREAGNASQLRKNFLDSPLLYIPDVYWDYCKRNVMVMERIYGIPVNDINTLKKKGISLQKLAERGTEIFFTQVFDHNFFHADMHPGNIMVDPDSIDEPRYMGVDFGIVGSLTKSDQRYLADNFLAFFNRDYRLIAELHLQSGWVPEGTSVDDFESSIRGLCEPIFNKPLSEISFGQFLLNLFSTARQFDMPIQPQLVLLQKTLFNIEGLGRQLYPDLDLWQTAKPFLEGWSRRQMSAPELLSRFQKQFPALRKTLSNLSKLSESQEKIQAMGSHLAEQMREVEHRRMRQNVMLALGVSSLFLGGFGMTQVAWPMWVTVPLMAMAPLTWILAWPKN